ncbi:MAG: type II toxin-antitoxin system HicA family toxin [Elusimicrobia bacterium]|nr:type II toxin-antitoxin system HicA family toxin [Elusimicrobiota bacterium]
MSRLPLISPARMAAILRSLGFTLIRQQGSHAFFRHPDGRATVVPLHKGEDLGRGLIRAILRDIELDPADYERLRRKI